MKWFNSNGEFKSLNEEQIKGLDTDDLVSYMEAKGVSEQKQRKAEGESLKLELKEIQETAKTQSTEINALKESQKGLLSNNQIDYVSKFIEENKNEISKIHSSGSGTLTIKVPEDITTASGGNINPPDITGTQQAPLSNVNLRNFDVTALTSNISTSLSAYPYTESVPKDGDYTFLAEGEIKPQIDFKWETNYAKPVKIAAWMKLSDESVTDVKGLQSVARDFLRKKHDLKKSDGILFGDGIAPNPKGATVYGRTFVAGDMASQVVKPNFMDVVNACVTDISTTHNYEDEMKYIANLVLVNDVDFFLQLVSAKDDNGLPLYPQAGLNSSVVIGGITIIPERSIPAGKIFVCDMSKYNTTNYVPYNVQIGWVNDDFIKNQFVILAESRFHAFVKVLDEQAFIYDDIATIKDAIEVVTP